MLSPYAAVADALLTTAVPIATVAPVTAVTAVTAPFAAPPNAADHVFPPFSPAPLSSPSSADVRLLPMSLVVGTICTYAFAISDIR